MPNMHKSPALFLLIWTATALSMLALLGSGRVVAQGTATPPSPQPLQAATTPAPQVVIVSIDPASGTAGQTTLITISGLNFTPSSGVQMLGIGPIPSNVINATQIRAIVPSNAPPGQYFIQVSDPAGGSARSPGPFSIVASTPTLAPTLQQPLGVSSSEPTQVVAGQSSSLSVFGANFTSNSVVRIVGVGFLPTTFVNGGVLTATIPESLNPGQYAVEVSDPAGGTGRSPSPLIVIGPSPLPPTPLPPPTETVVPTPVPGQPSLFVRAFSASPSSIAPGQTTTLSFEVVNQGNYTALGVAVSVDTGSKFIPANGQAGATLPNMAPGASSRVALKVIAASDATSGPNSIPVSITYSDSSAKTYSSKATLSVEVQKVTEAPQVLLVHYSADPSPVEPGKPIHLQVQVSNVGTDTAFQVLVRLPDKDNILLPGEEGDSFSVGTLAAGKKASVDLPLIVTSSAKDGFQTQPLVISYLQADKVQETTSSITIKIAKMVVETPLLMLSSYDPGADMLKPGDQFHLKVELQNIGKGTANNLVVAFGTGDNTSAPVSSTTTTGDRSNDNSPGPLNIVPSDTFAPLKTGGTVLVGTLEGNGAKTTVAQDFIVNAKVTSGVYSLPITVRYDQPDGTTVQTSLRASLVVVTPPQLQVALQDTLPPSIYVGQAQTLTVKIVNTGKDKVNLTTATFTGANATISSGAETPVSPLDVNGTASVPGVIVADAEGDVTITFTLHYQDDLNRDETIVRTYKIQAVNPPPQPTFVAPVATPEVEQNNSGDFWQRLLFGLLGLGS